MVQVGLGECSAPAFPVCCQPQLVPRTAATACRTRWQQQHGTWPAVRPPSRPLRTRATPRGRSETFWGRWRVPASAVKFLALAPPIVCEQPTADLNPAQLPFFPPGLSPSCSTQVGRKATGDCTALWDKDWVHMGLRKT